MTEPTDTYRRTAVAVLEGLRAMVYPNYGLEELSELNDIDSGRVGWALGVIEETDEGKAIFEPRLVVELRFDDGGRPIRYRCRDRFGRETQTPAGDLSEQALIKALERLHEKKEGPVEQLWRWLGRRGTQ